MSLPKSISEYTPSDLAFAIAREVIGRAFENDLKKIQCFEYVSFETAEPEWEAEIESGFIGPKDVFRAQGKTPLDATAALVARLRLAYYGAGYDVKVIDELRDAVANHKAKPSEFDFSLSKIKKDERDN